MRIRKAIGWWLGVAMLAPAALAAAQPAEHLGAASCASALCHAAATPYADAGIRQNEYLIWHRNDRHAGAWRTLESPESQRIAARLGDAEATERDDCLACHAAPVADRRTGPKFRIEDGIDCESCHGPAGNWIETHTVGYRDIESRRADGLYPTWDADTRAGLCLGCHLGEPGREITHRIMAAGHPPLRFELDTYTTWMPPHFRRDRAEAIGKPAHAPVGDWLRGQLQAARATLDRLERQLDAPGWLPELSLLDCHACHHDMDTARWQPRRSPALPVGHPRLADHPLVMLQLWLDVTGSDRAGHWRRARMALDRGYHAGPAELRGALPALRAEIDRLAQATPSDRSPRELALATLRRADTELAGDFALAEQLAMLSAVLVQEMRARDVPFREPEAIAALDRLYALVDDSLGFDATGWRRALWSLIRALEPASGHSGDG